MDNSTWLKEEERLDDLQRSGLHIIQHPHKFCFGMDAILLSHFVDMKKPSRILDLGTGTGVIPLMLSALWPDTTLEALEIQEESADMARRSIGLNALDEFTSPQVTSGKRHPSMALLPLMWLSQIHRI